MDSKRLIKNSSLKITWISLGVNLIFCCTLVPMALQPTWIFNFRQLLETLLWQAIALVGWPLSLLGSLLNFFWRGYSPDLDALLKILLYPAGIITCLLFLICRKNNWIPLIILHLLLILSFINIWSPVLNGYDFMIG